MGRGGESERTCVLTNGLRPETDGLSKRKSLVELDVDAVGLITSTGEAQATRKPGKRILSSR